MVTLCHSKIPSLLQVFATSADQETCTVGVWAAYDPINQVICVDTEGLLGVTSNQNKRTRLLLKVLAVSDVIIYRTCADRLHTDLFQVKDTNMRHMVLCYNMSYCHEISHYTLLSRSNDLHTGFWSYGSTMVVLEHHDIMDLRQSSFFIVSAKCN